MAKFRKRPVVIEAITFDELVEYGLKELAGHPDMIHNGMPWSFQYQGQPITHENDDCYLIPTLEGIMKFIRGDWLITGVVGEIYPCKADIFEKTYESSDVVPADSKTSERLRAALALLAETASEMRHPVNYEFTELDERIDALLTGPGGENDPDH